MPEPHRNRLYQLLLHLYPYDFRVEFGREMNHLLHRRLRDEHALLVWIATLSDLGPSAFKEHCHMLFQDLKYTFRALGRAPVFAAATILTLALGIGANVAIFSVVNAVMLQPLPFRDPARLVRIWETNPKRKIPFFSASTLNYLSWKEQSRSFDSISAFGSANLNLTGLGDPERLSAGSLTASLIPMLGIKMLAGRGFLPEEEGPGGARVAIIGEGLWERRFGRDPKILGQEIELNGAKTQIIGVAPNALRFSRQRFDLGSHADRPRAGEPLQPCDCGRRPAARWGSIGTSRHRVEGGCSEPGANLSQGQCRLDHSNVAGV